MHRLIALTLALVAALSMGSTVSLAQKAKDTLRVATTEPFKYVDGYYFPTPEGNFVTDEVYDGLIRYDGNGHPAMVLARPSDAGTLSCTPFLVVAELHHPSRLGLTAAMLKFTLRRHKSVGFAR